MYNALVNEGSQLSKKQQTVFLGLLDSWKQRIQISSGSSELQRLNTFLSHMGLRHMYDDTGERTWLNVCFPGKDLELDSEVGSEEDCGILPNTHSWGDTSGFKPPSSSFD